MNWTEILRRGGITEPPGREEALRPQLRRYRAMLRNKKTGVVIEAEIEAKAYYVALAHFRRAFKDSTIIRFVDEPLTDC
jgi:hypothetical protein